MTTASFVTYHRKHRELPALEFRAPPPSPVTGVLTGGSSGSPEFGEFPDVREDDDVGRFLRRSARVPVLRLPERAMPRKKKEAAAPAPAPAWAPPVIDMRLLASGGPAVEALRSASVSFGCFQVVGHGVSTCLVSASAAARRAGSPASVEMEAGGEDHEDVEESWWSPDFALSSRNRADDLFTQLERAAAKIMDALQRDSVGAGAADSLAAGDDRDGSSLLCIRTHHRKQRDGGSGSGPMTMTMSQEDVLRMLVRSSRCPRALALQLCPGASTFHVFSARRGCSGFRPLEGAVVVTVGDRLQVMRESLFHSSILSRTTCKVTLCTFRIIHFASLHLVYVFPSPRTYVGMEQWALQERGRETGLRQR